MRISCVYRVNSRVLRQYFRQFLELFADAYHPAARQFGCIARLSQFVNLIRASLQKDKWDCRVQSVILTSWDLMFSVDLEVVRLCEDTQSEVVISLKFRDVFRKFPAVGTDRYLSARNA